uniref:ACT domain-containing protein ACR n=1 Tax=Leersia perrieri TaxID=77586 RepID=A0A0D9W4A4_9ORYZ
MAMARCGGEDEYAKLVRGMNPPRVVIDNEASDDATVIRVDSVSSHGTLLAVVQVIADLDLVIRKAYFSSDGSWFMDVFYVTDRHGLKVLDPHTISYIQTTLEEDDWYYPEEEGMRKRTTVGIMAAEEYTVIELTGTDRPGLLSEVCAVLAAMGCAVRSAELWTHNARVAAVVHVTDAHDPDAAIAADESRVAAITSRLSTLLRSPSCAVRAASPPLTHMERRLHQMMFDDRDFVSAAGDADASPAAEVTVTPCEERGYTAVVVRCRDRPKLLFDTVCTITDMQYAIHHGAVSSVGEQPAGVAYQEYYIRHVDGEPLTSEAERRRVARCLQAAIERRAVAADAVVALEVRSGDRAGLLSDVTRIFRENGLTIRRAEITTASPEGRGGDGEAVDTFYVSDPAGNPVEAKTIEAIREQIGEATLRVKHNPFAAAGDGDGDGGGGGGDKRRRSGGDDVAGSTAFLFGNLFKFYRPFQNFSLIKLYS